MNFPTLENCCEKAKYCPQSLQLYYSTRSYLIFLNCPDLTVFQEVTRVDHNAKNNVLLDLLLMLLMQQIITWGWGPLYK